MLSLKYAKELLTKKAPIAIVIPVVLLISYRLYKVETSIDDNEAMEQRLTQAYALVDDGELLKAEAILEEIAHLSIGLMA